ncbi:cell division protein FtsN [Aliidiomarina shirensis]|uniref:Cell division protein FtsN n=1 Tax=Aliidiomarina shirensis TaxID=1048642 RepID=A0A432WT65_9GAMM|nr:SPOR domain-containing protein [Aliidiomarina shirensis]RUO36965.1 cell division protein FtsN [Aliidiomarina shirensis]
MAVDYAKRGAPKKKKPVGKGKPAARGATRKPANQKGAKSPVPIRALLVTLVVIAVFVSFLWFLKKGDMPTPVVDEPVDTVSAPALEPLPEIPAERWQYIEELESQQVEVEVPELAESRRRLMQCASFRSHADADNLKARIAMAGYESQIRETTGSNGRWFRVILGPFDNLRDAQRTNNQLQRTGIYGCQIWLWNLD